MLAALVRVAPHDVHARWLLGENGLAGLDDMRLAVARGDLGVRDVGAALHVGRVFGAEVWRRHLAIGLAVGLGDAGSVLVVDGAGVLGGGKADGGQGEDGGETHVDCLF